MEEVLAGKHRCPSEFRPVQDALGRYTKHAIAKNLKLTASRSRGGSMRGGSGYVPAALSPPPPTSRDIEAALQGA
jgi:hypothetical protein